MQGDGHNTRGVAAPYRPVSVPLAAQAKPPTLRTHVRRAIADLLPSTLLFRRGKTADRRVALTFDDGPHEMTDAYLDVLDKFSARATFFVVGRECESRRDVVARIADRGHELAGHGFTHKAFPKLDDAALRDELKRTAALLPPPQTARPLVRPPNGATSVRSLLGCARAGYVTVLWSLDSDDCRTAAPETVVERLSPARLTPGEIVLLHEGQSWTLEALPVILDRLQRAGFQAVTVGDLLNG